MSSLGALVEVVDNLGLRWVLMSVVELLCGYE